MKQYFTPNTIIPNAKARKYLYRVIAAGLAVAVGYRLITGEEAAMWISLAGVVLAVGGLELAAQNAPKELDEAEAPEVDQDELEAIREKLHTDSTVTVDEPTEGERY